MSRTTASAVIGILGEVDKTIDLAPFIETANLIVTKVCSAEYDETDDSDIAQLELVERWLSAHFFHIRTPELQSEEIGEAIDKFRNQKLGSGLLSTTYGNQAVALDTSGKLRGYAIAQSKQKGKPQLLWLGTELE